MPMLHLFTILGKLSLNSLFIAYVRPYVKSGSPKVSLENIKGKKYPAELPAKCQALF